MSVVTEKWKESSIHEIGLAQNVIARAENGLAAGRSADPLPFLRDVCVKESNDRIHAYVRATRNLVLKLRKWFIATNEEMKSLNRSKEALEKALEHERKDIDLNYESAQLREQRTSKEKQEPDGVNELLSKELTRLSTLKRSLESQLRKVQQQLQVLGVARGRLAAVIQERSRVTDLICHSLASSVRYGSVLRQGPIAPRKKAHSAPTPFALKAESHDIPEGVMTPEAFQAIAMATENIAKSEAIRQEVVSAISRTQVTQGSTHNAVNQGFSQKIAMTLTLQQHLQVSNGETNLTAHKCQRYYDLQEKAQGYAMGPVASSDLTTRERLDRPLVQVYQRHPGTDLPEALHVIDAAGTYVESMQQTMKNLQLLKLAGSRLRDDIADKKIAAGVDKSVLQLRRRKANHRWVMDSQPHKITSLPKSSGDGGN
eukprot:Em0016g754a